MGELVSIMMTAHNRKRQLKNTLWSIKHFIKDYDVEVIVIDDDSDEQMYHNELASFGYFINYYLRKGHTRQEPVIPNNIGFSLCNGDKIIFCCGETAFIGNIIKHAYNYLDDTKFICYSAYSINWETFEEICELNWRKPEVITRVRETISPIVPLAEHKNGNGTGWYAHPVHKPLALPFCAAITRNNLEKLCGYDERLVAGVGHADNDLLRRIMTLGLKIEWSADPFVIHQPHEKTDYSNKGLVQRNLDVSAQLQKAKTIKANQNKYYIR